METKTIQVAGTLHINEHEYYLALPNPVERESWQPDGSLRWLVVPKGTIGYNSDVHSFLRHVVTSPCGWWIDYGSAGKSVKITLYDEYVIQTDSPETGFGYVVTDPENGRQYKFDELEVARD